MRPPSCLKIFGPRVGQASRTQVSNDSRVFLLNGGEGVGGGGLAPPPARPFACKSRCRAPPTTPRPGRNEAGQVLDGPWMRSD